MRTQRLPLAPDRDWTWRPGPGASTAAMGALRVVAGVRLPEPYFEFLALGNGGEGPLGVQPFYFVLESAEEARQSKLDGTYEDSFPGFFVFGSNGGGECIAFDLRGAEPWPVVALDMTNGDLNETVLPIAGDFVAFLEWVGLESPDVNAGDAKGDAG